MQLPKGACLALIGFVMYSFYSYQNSNISLVVLNPSGDIYTRTYIALLHNHFVSKQFVFIMAMKKMMIV